MLGPSGFLFACRVTGIHTAKELSLPGGEAT